MHREQKALVAKIIKKHGPVIDLKAEPETLIEILRAFGRVFDDPPDGGSLPGGVGPVPPPPSSVVEASGVTTEELMKAILRLTRDVATIKTALKARG